MKDKNRSNIAHENLFAVLLLSFTVLLASCSNSSSTTDAKPEANTDAGKLDDNASGDSAKDNSNNAKDAGEQGDGSVSDNNGKEKTSNGNAASEDGASDSNAGTASGVAPPNDLIGVAYTDTELEIFWQAPTNTTGVVYNIIVDDVFVTTVDAKSYFMNGLTAATTYVLDVQSVDSEGKAGQRASIAITTADGGPTISTKNAEAIVEYVASITNGDEFADFISILDKVNGPGWYIPGIDPSDLNTSQVHGLEFTENLETDDGRFSQYNCAAGGTAQHQFEYYAQSSERNGKFENCRSNLTNEKPLDGTVYSYWEFVKSGDTPGNLARNVFNSMTITGDDGRERKLTGLLRRDPRSKAIHTWTAGYSDSDAFEYIKQSFEGQTTISNLDIDRTSGSTVNFNFEPTEPITTTLEFSYTVQSPETGNKLITVETLTPFIAAENIACFTQGEFKVAAQDGSQLVVSLNADNPATFNLLVTNNIESLTTTLTWSESNTFAGLKKIVVNDEDQSVPNCNGVDALVVR